MFPFSLRSRTYIICFYMKKIPIVLYDIMIISTSRARISVVCKTWCCIIGASALLSKALLLVPRYNLYLYKLSLSRSLSSLYIIFMLHHRCQCTVVQSTSAGTEIPGSRKFYDQQLNFRKTLCLISGPHQLEPAILQIPKKIIGIVHHNIMEKENLKMWFKLTLNDKCFFSFFQKIHFFTSSLC